jgi:hypothetical protein
VAPPVDRGPGLLLGRSQLPRPGLARHPRSFRSHLEVVATVGRRAGPAARRRVRAQRDRPGGVVTPTRTAGLALLRDVLRHQHRPRLDHQVPVPAGLRQQQPRRRPSRRATPARHQQERREQVRLRPAPLPERIGPSPPLHLRLQPLGRPRHSLARVRGAAPSAGHRSGLNSLDSWVPLRALSPSASTP